MLWNRARLVLMAAALLAAALLPLRSQEEKRVSVYSARANYSLNVQERDNSEYVGLLAAVDPLGETTLKMDAKSWRLRFNGMEAEFRPGKKRVRLGRGDYEMPAPFLAEGDRGLIPVPALPTLLSRLLNL